MRCPYCYQGTDKVNKSKLSDDDINYLLKYYKRVSDIWNYDEIVLKVLGGTNSHVALSKKSYYDDQQIL